MIKETENVSPEEKRFFVVRTKDNLPKDFVDDVTHIERELKNVPKSDIVNRYLNVQSRAVKIEFYSPGKYLVRTEVYEAVQRGYISPSMFIKYRRCARELVIEIMETKKMGGVLVTEEQLRSYLKGLLAHRLYYDRLAYGAREVRVESSNLGIIGYIDEVRKELDTYKVIEFKSSYSPDLVGAGLQVMSYMLAFADQNKVDLRNIEGYIYTLKGIYRVHIDKDVFDEYMKRLRKVVDIALSGDTNSLPPRLSSDLSSRCRDCPYRGQCHSLPDNYRSYQRFFDDMGFKTLAEKKPRNTLFSYVSKS